MIRLLLYGFAFSVMLNGCSGPNQTNQKNPEDENISFPKYEGTINDFIHSVNDKIDRCYTIEPGNDKIGYSEYFNFRTLAHDFSDDVSLRYKIEFGKTRDEVIVTERDRGGLSLQYNIVKSKNFSFIVVKDININYIFFNKEAYGNTGFFLVSPEGIFYFGFGFGGSREGDYSLRTVMKVDSFLYPSTNMQFWHDGLSYYSKVVRKKDFHFIEYGELIDSNKTPLYKFTSTQLLQVLSETELIDTIRAQKFIPTEDTAFTKTYPWLLNGDGVYRMGIDGPVIIWH